MTIKKSQQVTAADLAAVLEHAQRLVHYYAHQPDTNNKMGECDSHTCAYVRELLARWRAQQAGAADNGKASS